MRTCGSIARARECDFGAWEGLTAGQVDDAAPGRFERWHADPSERAPGGESLHDVGDRVSDLLLELARENHGHAVVVVSHVMAIRAAVGRLVDLPSTRWGALRVPAASLTIVRLWADGDRELVSLGTPSDL